MGKTVSIYIPTHNRPQMLERALESITKQTWKDIQVLVCDDGSQLDCSFVINKYKDKFSDFVFIRNQVPMGACSARNKLIELADGEYLTGLDDDDEFLPTRIEDFLTSEYLSKYSYLCAGHITKTSEGAFRQKVNEGKITLENLLSKNIVGNQIFTKTENLRKSGGFDKNLPAWQDYDAWVMLTKICGDGYKVEKYNYKWNIDHEEDRISNSDKARIGYELFVEKHMDILNKKNIDSLFFQDKINRNQKISTEELYKHFSLELLKVYTKYQIKRKLPFIKRMIYKY